MDSTLTSVGLSALTEGVKFLYAQAGEVLARRRAAHDRAAEEQAGDETLTAPLDPPEGTFMPGQRPTGVALSQVDAVNEDLLRAKQAVESLLYGGSPASLSRDQAALLAVERLRSLLERVYGVSLTFVGENRSAGAGRSEEDSKSGVVVNGNVTGDIAGRDMTKTTAPND